MTSEPYLLVVTGEEACLSGLESVGDRAQAALRIHLKDGRYSVRTTLVAWDEEPDSKGSDGRPTATALPDFVIALAPEQGTGVYRIKEETFDPPD